MVAVTSWTPSDLRVERKKQNRGEEAKLPCGAWAWPQAQKARSVHAAALPARARTLPPHLPMTESVVFGSIIRTCVRPAYCMHSRTLAASIVQRKNSSTRSGCGVYPTARMHLIPSRYVQKF
jgi:hypothetical protein